MQPTVIVRGADGSTRRHPVGERTVVGSGEMAHVTAGDPALSPEHLLLSVQPGGCWVSVAQGAAPVLDAGTGEPVTAQLVAWGTALVVGATQLTLELDAPPAAAAAASPATKPKPRGPSPILVAALIAAVGWLASDLLLGDGDSAVTMGDVEVPALFADAGPCPSETRPLYHAERAFESAVARAERYPFDGRDGVAAAGLFAEAEACFRLAARPALAEDAARRGAAIRHRVERDFATYRLSLQRALDAEATARAREATAALLELCGHLRGSDYLTALETLQRKLNLTQEPTES